MERSCRRPPQQELKAAFEQQESQRRQNEPVKQRTAFRELIKLLRAGNEVRLVAGREFLWQYVLVHRTQVGLGRAGVDAERADGIRPSERVEAKLVGSERDVVALARRFALHSYR